MYLSMATAIVELGPFFQFLNPYTVSKTPWTIDQYVARPVSTHRTIETENKHNQTTMTRVGFETKIPVFERTKTVHDLDRAATVIGTRWYYVDKMQEQNWLYLKFCRLLTKLRIRYSSVSIATCYGLNGPGSISVWVRLSFFTASRPSLGPPSLLYNGYCRLFPRVLNRQEREPDHSPPSGAEVQKCGAILPLPHRSSWRSTKLIKHKNNLWHTCQFSAQYTQSMLSCLFCTWMKYRNIKSKATPVRGRGGP
jgi:hypothetical protein